METTDLLPNDKKTEEYLLGAIIQLQMLEPVRDILRPETFFTPFYADVYRAMESIDRKGNKPDLLQIIDEMRRLGLECKTDKLEELAEKWGFHDIQRHALILVELQKRRELVVLSQKIKALSLDRTSDLGSIFSEIENEVKRMTSDQNATFSTIDDAIKGVMEQMRSNLSDRKRITGSETGFDKFDDRSGGLQKSDLIIVAGETSHGKSALAISIALNASKNGDAIAFYSLEMKKEQIAARMMSIKTGIPPNQIMYSRLVQEHFDIIDRNISSLYNRKIFFDDRSTSNIDTIIASIRTLKNRHNIDGAIVDYLQILNVNMRGANKEQQMGDVARRLKNLAKDLDIWIIAISQLSRDNSNPEPNINRLRDSGQIAEAADVVILVYRPEIKSLQYKNFKNAETRGTALFDVVKGRNIGMMQFICGFNELTTNFYEVSELDIIKHSTKPDCDDGDNSGNGRPF